MKYKITLVTLALAVFILLIIACEGPDQPTYTPSDDPNPTGKSPASIDSVIPNQGYLKDVIKIYGKGFNSDPLYNFVSFGTQVGKCLSASSTMLEVLTPSINDQTVDVKVAIKGSEFWSNGSEFTFFNTLAVIDTEIVWPNGVAVDDNDNVYVGSAEDGIIYKIDPDGNKTEFASIAINGSMEFGPDNYLYVCELGEEKIERISPDGSMIEEVVSVPGPVDFDWDQAGNMYIVENETGIHRLDPSGTLTYMVDLSTAKCCRVFGNYLYVSAIWDGKISRFEITGSGLGDEEVIMEELDSPVGIEFDVNGTMYYTLAWETSLFTMDSDGNEEVLYEGELTDPAESPIHYITFYKKKMYMVHPGWADVGLTMSAYIGVEQAPNYGRP